MDFFTFVSSVINSLAWPSVLIVVLFIFKKEIFEALGNIKRLEVPGVNVDFSEEVKEVMRETAETIPEPENNKIEELSDLARLAEHAPRGAIVESWLEIERALTEAGRRQQYSDEKTNPNAYLSYVIHGLKSRKFITKEAYDLFHRLKDLRNKAVHSNKFELSKDSAVDYANMATRLISEFEKA